MARYDRIARIPPPQREQALPGWFTLRDLEGREREPELGRRARLRYLAIRPVLRLLQHGLEGGTAESVSLQVDAVRQELSQLPTRDPERERLARYLREIGGPSPSGLARATLDVGQAAEAAGHRYAAEEFYQAALELALAHSLADHHIIALRLLGRVLRERAEWGPARSALEESAALADRAGDSLAWSRAMEGLAAVDLRAGKPDRARRTLEAIEERAVEAGGEILAVARAGRCALELAEHRTDEALLAGWEAISLLTPADEHRNGVLLNMAAAFRRQGLYEPAATCYEIVIRWAAWAEHRAEARMERAVVAAEAGDEARFMERRKELLESLDRNDRYLAAMLDLGLGRGALLVGNEDVALQHLRQAISAARDMEATEILDRSEELLTALETGRRPDVPRSGAASAEARKVGERLERLAPELVAS